MKLLALLTLGAVVMAGGVARSAELVVTVTNVRNATGRVELCLWRDARDWPDCTGNPTVQRRHVPAAIGSVTATFTDLAPGIYAVSAFHDEKGLRKVETNFLGIPRSGVGASRDPKANFGPPPFRDAAFTVPEGRSAITFTLRYP